MPQVVGQLHQTAFAGATVFATLDDGECCKMFIDFNDDGTVTSVGDFPELGVELSKQRVSHVEPVNVVLRLCFHAIRRCVSDESKVAEWTRGWKVQWRARMLVGDRKVLGPFADRKEAIRAEISWLDSQ